MVVYSIVDDSLACASSPLRSRGQKSCLIRKVHTIYIERESWIQNSVGSQKQNVESNFVLYLKQESTKFIEYILASNYKCHRIQKEHFLYFVAASDWYRRRHSTATHINHSLTGIDSMSSTQSSHSCSISYFYKSSLEWCQTFIWVLRRHMLIAVCPHFFYSYFQ